MFTQLDLFLLCRYFRRCYITVAFTMAASQNGSKNFPFKNHKNQYYSQKEKKIIESLFSSFIIEQSWDKIIYDTLVELDKHRFVMHPLLYPLLCTAVAPYFMQHRSWTHPHGTFLKKWNLFTLSCMLLLTVLLRLKGTVAWDGFLA